MGLSPEQVTEAQARAEKLKASGTPVAKAKDQIATVSDATGNPRN
jgi:hypothetical protein